MKRIFVLTSAFERSWERMGLGDRELEALQQLLLVDPEAGAVIQQMAGARKIRIPMEGRGKSAGGL